MGGTAVNGKVFKPESWGKILILLAIFLLYIFPITFVFEMLSYPYPLEYRDAVVVSAATDISRGINFYRAYTYPDHIYLYGFLYPLMIAPFVNFVEHPILAARWIDVTFLLLFLLMSFDIFRMRKASVNSSLIGALILFNSTCLIWKINGSRPDIIGLFFSILSIYVLMKRGFGVLNLLLCAAIAVMSFYFKQYMLFTVPVIAAYSFLFLSKKKGLIFGSAAGALLLVSFLLAWQFLPLLYEYTFMHHIVAERNEAAYLIRETRNFFRYYWPLVFAFFIVIYQNISAFFTDEKPRVTVDLLHAEKPLLQGISMSWPNTGMVISSLLLIFVLGGHRGNTYTYFGELLLPFLLYSVMPGLDHWIGEKGVLAAAQFMILIFAVLPFPSQYAFDFADSRRDFESLYAAAGSCENILDLTPLVGMYKIENERYPVYANGHRVFADSLIPEPDSLSAKLTRMPEGVLEQRLDEWNRILSMNISEQSFDCIFTDTEYPIDEIDGYVKTREFDSLRNRKVFQWIPVAQQ